MAFFAVSGFLPAFFAVAAEAVFALLDAGEATDFLFAIFDLATDLSASAFKDRRPTEALPTEDVDAPFEALLAKTFPFGEVVFTADLDVDFEPINLGSFEAAAVAEKARQTTGKYEMENLLLGLHIA